MAASTSTAPRRQRWGEDDSDDDNDDKDQLLLQTQRVTTASGGTANPIPPTHRSRVDKQGVQIVTSYRAANGGAGSLIKTIQKVRVTLQPLRENKAVEFRKTHWRPFGQAATEEGAQSTILSKDEIFIEDPHADTDLQEEDPTMAISGNLSAFWAKQKQRKLEEKYGVTLATDTSEEAAAAAQSGWTQVGAAAAPTASGGPKYVPPSMRGATGPAGAAAAAAGSTAFKPSANRLDDLNTIRVTNLSESTTEADLQELFSAFGRISRVYLAKDKETLASRGFAFVSFYNQQDAATAMEELQGYGYDHLILKLEWARPNAPKDPATSGTEYRSGYGKALAQDTTAKVSYASNLTK
jgi:translation initiation factor 3 subunit G